MRVPGPGRLLSPGLGWRNVGAALSSKGRWVSKDWDGHAMGVGRAWGQGGGGGVVPAKVYTSGRWRQESWKKMLSDEPWVESGTSRRWTNVIT